MLLFHACSLVLFRYNPKMQTSAFCLGFEKPSAIQQRAIKQIIKGRDVIAQ